ncbi:hypothetical protein J6590_042079 [Homalodisca vitripennis]|nr:hypothetical protein J6590_042079 [Homalodisca vitripennis]
MADSERLTFTTSTMVFQQWCFNGCFDCGVSTLLLVLQHRCFDSGASSSSKVLNSGALTEMLRQWCFNSSTSKEMLQQWCSYRDA